MASSYAVAGQASATLDSDGFIVSSMAGTDGSGGGGDARIGLFLAMSSSLAIGASFIVKKKGLKLAGGAPGGVRAGSGGYGYLRQPMWWAGMLTMIVGEVANFAAYAFAPAVLVTPLGALSIIVSAVLAHHLLAEKLHAFGWLGCLLCIVGSVEIVLNAPEEKEITGVKQLFAMAARPGFVAYAGATVGFAAYLATRVYPTHGSSNILVPIGICSLVGSLSVMSCKALGTALKLTFQGRNQLLEAETWMCAAVVGACVVTQMNYLNKALDVFNTAVVTPIYYVMFTTLTLTASSIMFRDYLDQGAREVAGQICGFVTILAGVFTLHVTKDHGEGTTGAGGGGWGGGWGARATGATGASSNGRRTVGGARRRGTRTDLGRRTETDRRGGRTSSWRSRGPTRARERNARTSRVSAAASSRVDTGRAVFEGLTLS